MAKTPELVTVAEWKKAKPLTLKDPGLDKKLAEWEKVKKEVTATPRIAGFASCAAALKEVVTMSKTVQAACNKVLHKDAIVFLGGYTAAVAKAAQGLQKLGEDYSKKVAAWSKKRVDCLAGMKKHETDGKELTVKFESTKKTCEKSKGHPKFGPAGIALAQGMIKDINKFKEKAKDTMDIVRIDDPATRIHVDDRDQKYIDMFTQSIQIQSILEGNTISYLGYLDTYIKENKK